jgi:hypothetical protein
VERPIEQRTVFSSSLLCSIRCSPKGVQRDLLPHAEPSPRTEAADERSRRYAVEFSKTESLRSGNKKPPTRARGLRDGTTLVVWVRSRALQFVE